MPEQLPDLRQCCARTKQLRRGSMSQAMRIDGPKARTRSRSEDNLGDTRGAESPMRCTAPDEEGSLGCCRRAASAQITRKGAPYVGRQRHGLDLRAFPTNHERAGAPIDVVELQLCGLSCTQAKSDQCEEDGKVATSSPCATVARAQKCLHIGGPERLGQSG
jgi:hypothetical protein